MSARHSVRVAATAAVVLAAVVMAPPPAAADWVRDKQWHLEFLKIAQVHRITKGAGVTVAVIDTGVDAGHPDLRGAVLPGADFDEIPARRRDGRVDVDGHGTGMAGLIAARGRGGRTGALGIAPEAKILPVRYDSGSGVTTRTGQAITWAAQHGADVINMSFSGPHGGYEIEKAIEEARKADVIVVAGAGNQPESTEVGFPAAYPGVLAAAGVDRKGNHAAVSVTGREVVLAAPAVDITSTDKQGNTGYLIGSGTSNSSAIVAGAAALVRAKFPDLSADEVVHRLTATARDKGSPGRDEEYGYGVLDIEAALTADVPKLAGTAGPNTPSGDAAPRATPSTPRSQPLGLAIIGLGVLVFVIGGLGAGAWYLARRRHRPTASG